MHTKRNLSFRVNYVFKYICWNWHISITKYVARRYAIDRNGITYLKFNIFRFSPLLLRWDWLFGYPLLWWFVGDVRGDLSTSGEAIIFTDIMPNFVGIKMAWLNFEQCSKCRNNPQELNKCEKRDITVIFDLDLHLGLSNNSCCRYMSYSF